jgi:hypothetical protein
MRRLKLAQAIAIFFAALLTAAALISSNYSSIASPLDLRGSLQIPNIQNQ